VGDYATNAQLKTRFENDAELAALTDNVSAGIADEDVLTDVIATAESEINSALAMRYLTPVDVSLDTDLAALLQTKTLDLAEVYLHRRGEGASQIKLDQRDAVLEWCEMMATGKRVLVGAITAASTVSRDPRAAWTDNSRTQVSTSGRAFSRETTEHL